MTITFLPPNSTPLARALDLSCDPAPDIDPALSAISGWKHVLRPPDLRPFLVSEYGLDPLVAYLDTLTDVLDLGLPWARVRGTHGAVDRGLAMVGYAGEIIDPPARRRAWAEFQINLDRVRDTPGDLERIAGVVGLSIPVRSHFRRGVHGYDVPAAETSETRLSEAILGDDSGIRIKTGAPKWSFGRCYQFDLALGAAELIPLGIWIPALETDLWVDMTYPWVTSNFKWSDDSERGRRVSMAANLEALPVHVRFADADGNSIGFSKAICKAVSPGLDGYAFGSDLYQADSDNPIGVHVFCHTGWHEGVGVTAASASVVFDGTPADQNRPSRLWLAGNELTNFVEFTPQAVNIDFGTTCRSLLQFLLRF